MHHSAVVFWLQYGTTSWGCQFSGFTVSRPKWAVVGAAAAQDPPSRAGRISYVSGAPAGVSDWVAATVSRPRAIADQIYADSESRAEVHLPGDSPRGAWTFAPNLYGHIEIDTPNLAFTVSATLRQRQAFAKTAPPQRSSLAPATAHSPPCRHQHRPPAPPSHQPLPGRKPVHNRFLLECVIQTGSELEGILPEAGRRIVQESIQCRQRHAQTLAHR